MEATAVMRVLGTDETPLELERSTDPYIVMVPGFGALMIGRVRSDELIARLGAGAWHAVLIRPDAAGGFSASSRHVERAVVEVDGKAEVELLHNNDRLTVVLTPATEGAPA